MIRKMNNFLIAVIMTLIMFPLITTSFQIQSSQRQKMMTTISSTTTTSLSMKKGLLQAEDIAVVSNRRDWIKGSIRTIMASSLGSGMFFVNTSSGNAAAVDEAVVVPTVTSSVPKLPMKQFVDPEGLFSLSVPKSFFTLRRTVKGDLPDAKTGKGRRGSSIFTGGDMAKAEVVAVERYPIKVLLEENGIETTGDLTTFSSLGEPAAIASLIIARREKDAANQGLRVLKSVSLSPDGKELSFQLKTEIEVQKPELLLEQYGVSQLFRITVAKASLNSNDGNLMAVFASGLEQDFMNGIDGPALQETADSFIAINQNKIDL